MKTISKNIWRNLSSSQKLNLIGSGLLIISLFLNWYSDKDIFRSGEIYSGLDGPLYFVGFTLLALALGNVAMIGIAALKVSKKITESNWGKGQMAIGFASMYLLMVVNSVYFHPQFGLNLLSKKSEIGVMVALVATVMVCIGGYLAFRHKFETEEEKEILESPVVENLERQHVSVVQKEVAEIAPIMASVEQKEAQIMAEMPVFSERDSRGKTEFERVKLYENLRKTMMRDTMSPDERRKARQKEVKESAFSANFGKTAKANTGRQTVENKTVTAQPAASTSSEKKPQMYRLDL